MATDRVARARDVSMAGLALAWLLASPHVTSIVVGPMRPEHLSPVVEALARPLGVATSREIGALF